MGESRHCCSNIGINIFCEIAGLIGVQGLRVVDISAFALLPPGQPQATVCEFYRGMVAVDSNVVTDALAEKIADDILKG